MALSQQDLTELEKYYTANHPEVFQDDSSLLGRSGEQLANLPSNILKSFVNTGEAITNLGIAPSEQQAPTDIPKPFDIPEAKTTGQQAVDILLQHLAPELAAALVPYSGVSRLARGVGLGEVGTQIAAQGAAGAFTGIKSGPEEAIKQAAIGGGLGGLSVLPRLQRLLPLAGLSAADAGLTYAQTGSGQGALSQAGLDAIFGLLPGAHPTEVPRISEVPPVPEVPQRPTGLTGEQPFYPTTDISALTPPIETQLRNAGFPFQVGAPQKVPRVSFQQSFTEPHQTVPLPELHEIPSPITAQREPTNYLGAENIVQDQAKSKTQTLPEYMRSEGGAVYPPLLHAAAGGVIGGALPADDTTQRFEHAAIGAGIGLAAGHALTERTNRIGAIGDIRSNKDNRIELTKNFHIAAENISKRTSYGLRTVIPLTKSFKANWSNAFQRWDVVSTSLSKGKEVKLDANEILIKSNRLADAQLIAQPLPELPLNKFSTENVFKKGLDQPDIDAHLGAMLAHFPEETQAIKNELEKQGRDLSASSVDTIKATSDFLDKISAEHSAPIQEEPSKIVSTALRDSSQPDIPPVTGKEWNSPHASLTMDALASGMDDTKLEYGFIDNKGNFLTRAEAEPIAKQAGQVPEGYKSGSNGMQSQDLREPPSISQRVMREMPNASEKEIDKEINKRYDASEFGFISPHLATTVAGAGIGGATGYRESGGDPNAAFAGAIIGGAGGYFGYKAIEALTRPNPRLKEGNKLIGEIKQAAKEVMSRPSEDIAGEDVRGRGGIMSKFIRGMEYLGRLNLPEEIKTAWTQARGTGVLGVQAVKDSLDALKGFKPTPEIIDIASKYIDGQLIEPGVAIQKIRSEGGISPSEWEAMKAEDRPKGWGVWKVGIDPETEVNFHVSPATRATLMQEEENLFRDKLGPDNELYFKFANTARKAIDNLQNIFAEGMPDGRLKRIIQGSIGQYVTRTYRIFNDKNYQPSNEQVQAAMEEYGQFLDSKGIEHTKDFLRIEIEQYLSDVRSNKAIFGLGQSGRKIDTTLLAEREELSPTFRELLGKYTDPTERLTQAISRLFPSAQASRFISLTKDMVIDGIPASMSKEEWVQQSKLLEQAKPDLPPSEYQSKLDKLNSYIDVGKNLKFGELSGLRVNRFVADQLLDYEGNLGMFSNPVMRGINNYSKVIHTAYDPIRYIRNIVTTPIFLWMGRASPESLGQAFKILKNKSGSAWEEMVANGVLTADQVSSEFRGSMDKLFNGQYDSDLTSKFKAFHNRLLEVYRYPDLLVRAATYLEAKSRYSKELKLPIDNPKVVTRAVQWTDERTMNYDNIAPSVRIARQLPFFNLYISYTAEIARIMKNVGRDAMKGDIHSLAQLGTIAGAFDGAQAISEAMLSDKDRKDWKQANAQSPDYSRSRYKFVSGRDKDGNFHYLDFTPWIPTDNINQMVRSIAKGDIKGLASINPVVGLDNTPAFKLITQAVSNKDLHTQRDYRNTTDMLMGVVQELSPTLTPGVGYEWKKVGSIGQENVKTGRQETWGGTITRYLTGANYTSVNPSVTQRTAIAQAKQHIANERAYLNDTLKMKGIDPEAKQRAVKKYQDAVSTILETFRQKAAIPNG